ncbi:hypothetical protein [Calycomorphotria hydatis]|nr:hypothetical protein [Calycomorphotria hydatis]
MSIRLRGARPVKTLTFTRYHDQAAGYPTPAFGGVPIVSLSLWACDTPPMIGHRDMLDRLYVLVTGTCVSTGRPRHQLYSLFPSGEMQPAFQGQFSETDIQFNWSTQHGETGVMSDAA